MSPFLVLRSIPAYSEVSESYLGFIVEALVRFHNAANTP